ncbi:MAG: hypothetical protein M1839_002143 [Geoglossum umbratile]|nr:MAG: hypothetical protein M1839_002143 [Geoglossum umbratile]
MPVPTACPSHCPACPNDTTRNPNISHWSIFYDMLYFIFDYEANWMKMKGWRKGVYLLPLAPAGSPHPRGGRKSQPLGGYTFTPRRPPQHRPDRPADHPPPRPFLLGPLSNAANAAAILPQRSRTIRGLLGQLVRQVAAQEELAALLGGAQVLAEERQPLVERREALVEKRVALVEEREAFAKEREAAAGQVEAAAKQKEALAIEREAAVEEREAAVRQLQAAANAEMSIAAEGQRKTLLLLEREGKQIERMWQGIWEKERMAEAEEVPEEGVMGTAREP